MEARKPLKDTWVIKPEKTALLVIDMQRAFVDAGSPITCVGAGDFVPMINQLGAKCRTLGIPVIFVKMEFTDYISESGLLAEMHVVYPDSEWEVVEGRKGVQFCDGLDITKDDYIVPKKRYSALIPGSSILESLLQDLGREELIIVGVATDICVGTTTMDAMMLGYRVFLVSDLTGTFSEERKNMALKVYDRHFAKVMTSREIIEELRDYASDN